MRCWSTEVTFKLRFYESRDGLQEAVRFIMEAKLAVGSGWELEERRVLVARGGFWF